jgi:AcrR family transcriptional regulator
MIPLYPAPAGSLRWRGKLATADRRAQERVRRREAILQAARAVFAEHGFRRATIDEVAARAEVGKGTVYLYFSGKEDILAELLLRALDELGRRLQAANDDCPVVHPDQRLRALADAYLTFAQNAPDYFRLLTAFDRGEFVQGIGPAQREHLLTASNRALELATQAIADGMELGIFAPGDARQAAGVLWAALNGALTLMAHPLRRTLIATDAAGLCRAALEVCLRGLAKS